MAVSGQSHFFTTLYATGILAANPQGMTVGQVNKDIQAFTYGQVRRVLQELCDLGYAYCESEKYGRTGKCVYRLTEAYAMEISFINRTYMKNYQGAL